MFITIWKTLQSNNVWSEDPKVKIDILRKLYVFSNRDRAAYFEILEH